MLHKGKGVENSPRFVLFKPSETVKICILHNGFCVRETRFLACGNNMDRGFVSVGRCEGVWSEKRVIGGWIKLYRALQSLFSPKFYYDGRFQWPRGLRRGSAAARLLRLRVRIPPGHGCLVCCECCVLPNRDLCVWLITRPSPTECGVGECYRET